MRGYEDGMKGTQLRTFVEKEVDRARKKLVDEHRGFIRQHDKKCCICEERVKVKPKDRGRRPIIDRERDSLYCQECFTALDSIDWDLELAQKLVEVLRGD